MNNTDFQLLAAVIAAGGQLVISKQNKRDAKYMGLQVDHIDSTDQTVLTAVSAYGRCCHCGGVIVERERKPDGNDKCENGHVYPHNLCQ